VTFPQPGDAAIAGFVVWVQTLDMTARGNGLVFVGEVVALAGAGQRYDSPPDPASPSGAAAALSLWRSPLRFQFSSQVEVVVGQSVVFDVAAAEFGAVATNIRPS
jgi:hypothetical protein